MKFDKIQDKTHKKKDKTIKKLKYIIKFEKERKKKILAENDKLKDKYNK